MNAGRDPQPSGDRRSGGPTLPFRVAIITLVVGVLLGCMGFVLLISRTKGSEMIDYFSNLYVGSLAEVLIKEVQAEAAPAVRELQAMDLMLETGEIDEADPIRTARVLAASLRGAEELSWLSVSFGESGRFIGANRTVEDSIVVNLSLPDHPAEEFEQDEDGTFVPYDRQNTNIERLYDPRQREWFREAVEAEGAVIWTEPYEFHEGVNGITAARAFRDAQGTWQIVGTADFTLSSLSKFLSTQKVAEDGAAVLLLPSGRALARIDWSVKLKIDDSEVRKLLASVDPASREPQRILMPIGGEIFEIDATPFQAAPGLDLTAVVVIPQSDFLQPVTETRNALFLILLLTILVGVGLGIWLSVRISQPLSQVSRELDAISHLTIDDPGHRMRPSGILEIAKVQDAVKGMRASLGSLLRYAPREVVLGVVESGQEAILGGEKREVTLLFADLRGFTRFAENRKPEEVVHFLNAHADRMNEIVIRHSGYVCDFIGDALFAVFGAPQHDPDHAEHAVEAALEMQRVRGELNASARAAHEPTLHLGIGICTGPSIVGNLGAPDRIKYDAIGHAVNLASRIESFAPPDTILIGTTTRALLGAEIRLRGPRAVSGKGIDEPIEVFEVLDADRSDREMHPVTPPAPIRFRRVRGKAVDQDSTPGRLLETSAEEVALETDEPLDLFATLQLLPLAAGCPALDLRVTDCEAEPTGTFRVIGRIASEEAVADRWLSHLGRARQAAR